MTTFVFYTNDISVNNIIMPMELSYVNVCYLLNKHYDMQDFVLFLNATVILML